MEKVNVVCVNWGTKYPKEYTERLYNMIKRNTTKDFDFWVLTDQHVYKHPINTAELHVGYTGWWNKLQMFDTEVLPAGEWLYFDLDVVIVDNIDSLFEWESFGIIRDFIRPENGILPGKEFNSSVMRFNNTEFSGIWEYYLNNSKQFHDMQKQVHFFGDQNVISSYLNHYPEICNPFPDEWLWSYKKGVERGKHAGNRSEMFGREIPKDGKVCVFHGEPNPVDVADKVDWIKDNYK
jgi:hypothetical protein